MSRLIAQAADREAARDIAGAEALLRQALQKDPKSAGALQAIIRFYLRRPSGASFAAPHAATLIKVAPKDPVSFRLLAQVETELAQHERALVAARQAVAIAPDDAENLFVLGSTLRRVDQPDEARRLLEQVIAARPDHLSARMELGRLLLNLGDVDGAAEIARALARDFPDNLAGIMLYADTTKVTAHDPIVIDAKTRLLPRLKSLNAIGYSRALRTLGKIETDLGNHAEAFRLITEAKTVTPAAYDEARYKSYVRHQISGISRAQFFGASGSSDETPVFIVGMPRSGSTLLEQILAAHPQIGGIGESVMMGEIAKRLQIPPLDGGRMVQVVGALSGEISQRAAGDYLAYMRGRIGPDARRGVDKFLHNFERLGLIAKLFPKAHVIHALRDPMDTCVSCYLSPLPSGHGYTQDLGQLGRYYRTHLDLMAHWKTVLPLRIKTIRYEEVVADPEGQARAMIDFLGLDWDPACLQFQDTKNAARTLSTWQVRQPIYSTSVQRWKRYDAFLGPLKKELAGLYPEGLG